jgi:hypothetical protein
MQKSEIDELLIGRYPKRLIAMMKHLMRTSDGLPSPYSFYETFQRKKYRVSAIQNQLMIRLIKRGELCLKIH